MKTFLQKTHRYLFYACWIVLGLIQSGYTELLDDEAYYWVYSRFLDWGYFDHPPMVALLIKIGYFFFHNELGVRLLFLLLNTLSLVLIEKLIERKNPLVFYLIVLSLAVLQLGGFLAVPDTPLIFFTALFFTCYKQFVSRPSFFNSLLLGVVMAALLYSKYHAVLIVFFVLLSNLRLLTRYHIYVAGLVAISLFIPHLWWQYQHDWISFRYHLFESNVNPYKLSYTLEYLGGQILMAGPLAGIILVPAAFLYHSKNIIDRGLKFTLAGIYVFFLVSSFRGKVEANWTSPVIVPLIILSHNFLVEKNTILRIKSRRWLLKLFAVTMPLVLLARIVLLVDIVPIKELKKRYHAWRSWPQQMNQRTNGLPIVFENSYQRASKYWFYSGQVTYSLNWYRERRNNYNFWPIEDSFLGKPVFLLDIYNLDSFQNKMNTAIGTVGYRYDSSFSSFAKVQFTSLEKSIYAKRDSSFTIRIKPSLPSQYLAFILAHPDMNIKIVLGVFDKYKWIEDLPVQYSLPELIQTEKILNFNPHLPEGSYHLILSIYHVGTLTATHNSEKINLTVE
ncbi:MAG TPA: glycosyltransferase family 39 protein [Chitinophagaceae bacterium]